MKVTIVLSNGVESVILTPETERERAELRMIAPATFGIRVSEDGGVVFNPIEKS